MAQRHQDTGERGPISGRRDVYGRRDERDEDRFERDRPARRDREWDEGWEPERKGRGELERGAPEREVRNLRERQSDDWYDRSERSDRTERADRLERSDRPERGERERSAAERTERTTYNRRYPAGRASGEGERGRFEGRFEGSASDEVDERFPRENYPREGMQRSGGGTGYGYGEQHRAGLGGEAYGRPQIRGAHYGKGPKGWKRSDERIREDVNQALTDAGDIDATDIEVEVKSGEVTLKGTVPQRNMKRLAEDLVDELPGVIDVQNQIRVGDGGQSPTAAGSGKTTSGAAHKSTGSV